MKIVKENKELRVLTIKELRDFDGFSDVSDKQALEIITALKNFSLMAHKIISKDERFRNIPRIRKIE